MVPVAYSMCTVEGHRDKPTPAIGRVRTAWQKSTVAARFRDEMSIWVAASRDSREVRGRVSAGRGSTVTHVPWAMVT